jgi:tripartite-type tricarboxylate transporter receptor subunit TctC
MRLNRSVRLLVVTLLCASAPWLPLTAAAADFPTHPITIVVGFSAGGSSDVMARIVAEKLSVGLGQPVVVENRPGVGAIVGANYVAKARPDGYTLLLGASGPVVFNHALYAKLPYAPQDLAPISLISTYPLLLLVNANNPAKSVQELADFSKQNPDKANYSASSASFQLITELFNRRTGARFTHIPYKGANDSIAAVMSGDVTMTLADAGAASAGLQTGRVKALAVTSVQRHKDYPNIPTMSELGVDLKVSFWTGLLAPAGTPAPIVKRLQEELARVIDMPDVKSRLNALSVTPASSTPEEFATLIAAELALWRQVAQENNIKAN